MKLRNWKVSGLFSIAVFTSATQQNISYADVAIPPSTFSGSCYCNVNCADAPLVNGADGEPINAFHRYRATFQIASQGTIRDNETVKAGEDCSSAAKEERFKISDDSGIGSAVDLVTGFCKNGNGSVPACSVECSDVSCGATQYER